MNVLILAGGFGTRLKTLGETTPKGLIPTQTGTLLDHVWTDVQSFDTQVALVTNNRFFAVYSDWAMGKTLAIINDGAQIPENRRGAIGDILFALEELSWDDDLLVVPSDTYYEFSLTDFVAFAQSKNGMSTVLRDLLDPALIANRLGCATVEGQRITGFIEKPAHPSSTLAAIPFYYYPKPILVKLREYAASGGNLDAPGSIIPWLLSREVPVYGFTTTAKTLDVGTTQDVEALAHL